MSLPFNAWRSDQLSQATSSNANKTRDGRIESRKRKKREDGEKVRGEMGVCYFDRRLTKVKLITISSQLPSWQEFPFNILALVSVKINLARSHLSSDCGKGRRSEEREDEKNWSGEVGHAVLG